MPRVSASNVACETPAACASGHSEAMNWVKPASAADAGCDPDSTVITVTMNANRFMPESPRQLLVLHAMRNDGILAQPAHLVLFIVLEIAFEPFDMAVALK